MVVWGTKAKYEKKLLRLSTLKPNSNDLPTNISSQSCNQHLLYDLSFILQTVIDKDICMETGKFYSILYQFKTVAIKIIHICRCHYIIYL